MSNETGEDAVTVAEARPASEPAVTIQTAPAAIADDKAVSAENSDDQRVRPMSAPMSTAEAINEIKQKLNDKTNELLKSLQENKTSAIEQQQDNASPPPFKSKLIKAINDEVTISSDHSIIEEKNKANAINNVITAQEHVSVITIDNGTDVTISTSSSNDGTDIDNEDTKEVIILRNSTSDVESLTTTESSSESSFVGGRGEAGGLRGMCVRV